MCWLVLTFNWHDRESPKKRLNEELFRLVWPMSLFVGDCYLMWEDAAHCGQHHSLDKGSWTVPYRRKLDERKQRAAWDIHFSLSSTIDWCYSRLRSYFHFFLVTQCDLVCRTNRHSFLYFFFFGQDICQGNRNRFRKLCEGCGDFLFHLCILSINLIFFK